MDTDKFQTEMKDGIRKTVIQICSNYGIQGYQIDYNLKLKIDVEYDFKDIIENK
jgi:uncharacterized lipoprotein YddW (UPF0748 family)